MKTLKSRALGAVAGLFSAMLFVPALADNLAVVIGVSDYTDMPDLPDAAADARSMARMLSDAGFKLPAGNDTEQGSGATLNPSRDKINAILEDSGTFKNAEAVFIYFAGHGGQVDDQIYVLGCDARVPKADEGDKDSEEAESSGLRRSGIAIKEFSANFKPRRGKGIAVIVDACRSGNKAADDGPRFPDDCILICSTEARKRAQNGEGASSSPFTEAVIKEFGNHRNLLDAMETTAERLDKQTGQRPAVYIRNRTSGIAQYVLFPAIQIRAVSHRLTGNFTFKGDGGLEYASARSVEFTTKGGIPEGYATVSFSEKFSGTTYKGRVTYLGTWDGKIYSGHKQRILENDYQAWPEEKFSIQFADDFSSASGEFEFWYAKKNTWVKASGTFSK